MGFIEIAVNLAKASELAESARRQVIGARTNSQAVYGTIAGATQDSQNLQTTTILGLVTSAITSAEQAEAKLFEFEEQLQRYSKALRLTAMTTWTDQANTLRRERDSQRSERVRRAVALAGPDRRAGQPGADSGDAGYRRQAAEETLAEFEAHRQSMQTVAKGPQKLPEAVEDFQHPGLTIAVAVVATVGTVARVLKWKQEGGTSHG